MFIKIIYDNKNYDIIKAESIISESVLNFIKDKTKSVSNIVILDDYKVCSTCGKKIHRDFLHENFYKMKSNLDGYMNTCRECYNAKKRLYKRDYTRENKEKLATYNRQYWENNKEKIKERRVKNKVSNLEYLTREVERLNYSLKYYDEKINQLNYANLKKVINNIELKNDTIVCINRKKFIVKIDFVENNFNFRLLSTEEC